MDSTPSRNRLCDSKVSARGNPCSTLFSLPAACHVCLQKENWLCWAIRQVALPLDPQLIMTLKWDCGPTLVKCHKKNYSTESVFYLILYSHTWPLSVFLEIMILGWLTKITNHVRIMFGFFHPEFNS